MQPRQIFDLIKKWFWLIVLAALVGAGAGLAVNHFQPKKYQAAATVFVNSPNRIDYTSLLGAQQAAKAFASFPQSQPILEAAQQQLGDKSLSETQLATMVSVQNDLDSQFVIIQVSDSNPVRAARLASIITKVSINQFQGTVINGTNTKFIQNEITALQNQITSQEQKLTTLQSQPPSTQQTGQIEQLSANLNALRQQYGQDVTTYNDLNSVQVSLLQDAQVPQNPVGLGKPISMAIGLLVGLIAIAGVIILIEQTDDVLRTSAKVNKASGLSTLLALKQLPTTVRQLPWLNNYKPGEGVKVIVKQVTALVQHPISLKDQSEELEDTIQPVALVTELADDKARLNGNNKTYSRFELPESFLTLGVLLKSEANQHNSTDRFGRSLLITSPENGDGKTLVASQIALGLARIGVKVVLIDANVRNPQVHKIFGVINRIGLSTILYTDKVRGVTGEMVDTVEGALQTTSEANLIILSSGPVVDAAPVLLSTARMGEIVNQLSQNAFVVVDSPAILTASEAMILASRSDAILMVVNAKRTTTIRLNQSLDMLSHLHVPVLGVVLNRARKSGRD